MKKNASKKVVKPAARPFQEIKAKPVKTEIKKPAPKKVMKKPAVKKVAKPKTENQVTIAEIKKLYKKLDAINNTKVALLSEIAKKEAEVCERFDYFAAKVEDKQDAAQCSAKVDAALGVTTCLNAVAVKY